MLEVKFRYVYNFFELVFIQKRMCREKKQILYESWVISPTDLDWMASG